MKKSSFNLLIGVAIAFSLCLMTSCTKEKAVGKIQGKVTNATTNEPIQGVTISLTPNDLSAETDSEGHYEFINLEVGQYTVKGAKEGFETFLLQFFTALTITDYNLSLNAQNYCYIDNYLQDIKTQN